MTIMITRSKEKHRDRSDISRVEFAEPLVTLHTLQPSEALVRVCTGRESTLVGCGGGGGGEGVGERGGGGISVGEARRPGVRE